MSHLQHRRNGVAYFIVTISMINQSLATIQSESNTNDFASTARFGTIHGLSETKRAPFPPPNTPDGDEEWRLDTIAALTHANLGKYADAFLSRWITVPGLPMVTNDELTEIGMNEEEIRMFRMEFSPQAIAQRETLLSTQHLIDSMFTVFQCQITYKITNHNFLIFMFFVLFASGLNAGIISELSPNEKEFMEHKFGQILVRAMKVANDRLSHLDVNIVNKAIMVRLDAMARAKEINVEDTEIGKALAHHFIGKWSADPEVQAVMHQLDFMEEVEIWMHRYRGRLVYMINQGPPQKVRYKRGVQIMKQKKTSWLGCCDEP